VSKRGEIKKFKEYFISHPMPFLMKQETEIEQWRATTWATKEPETIEWINSFSDGDTFYDIGANIGIYSLYFCSLCPNGHVYSFEPSWKNCSRLYENMRLNGFSNMNPLNIAISNYVGAACFKESSTETGSSGGQIAEYLSTKMPTLIFCVDALSSILRFPNHIKIDIDGLEVLVIDGMICTISQPQVKSILVEFDTTNNDYLLHRERIIQCGFTTDNVFNKMENHSRVRRAREGIKCENIIFTRG
jgi:FkbM family methyltransferase